MSREKNVRIVSLGRTRCPRFASGVGRCSSLGEEGTNFMLTVNNTTGPFWTLRYLFVLFEGATALLALLVPIYATVDS